MTLRRKLLTIFLALGFMALIIVGLTFWMLTQWRDTNLLLQEHYQRSLLVQRISTATFRAFKELPDAVFSGDPDAPTEFAALLEPVEVDFGEWVSLAHNTREREQVQRVRAAYNTLLADADTFFARIASGNRQAARELLEGRLENSGFDAFGVAVDDAIASDRENRERIRGRTQSVRRNAWVVLAVAAFATLSLILLLAAYLSSDLFKPLKQLKEALERAAKGDFGNRLDTERRDEFGAINLAFNNLGAAVRRREYSTSRERLPRAQEEHPKVDEEAETSRQMLHQLVGRLQAQVIAFADTPEGSEQQALLAQIDKLSHAVSKMTGFGFPLDLTLAETDLRTLLYEVVVQHHEQFAKRSISFEIRVAPELGSVVIDRLKVREVLDELLDNALAALPERGGQLGLRATLTEDGNGFQLEVADNGKGIDRGRLERALSLERNDDVGLKLSKAIIEEHGGSFTIESEPSEGTYVQLRFPLYQP